MSTYFAGLVNEANGATWIKFDLGATQYVRLVTLHYLFMEDFPKSEQSHWCLESMANWNICAGGASGYDIHIESEEGSAVFCGTMELSGKVRQADNIYSFDCDAVGRYVLLSGVGMDILLTEVVAVITEGKFNKIIEQSYMVVLFLC